LSRELKNNRLYLIIFRNRQKRSEILAGTDDDTSFLYSRFVVNRPNVYLCDYSYHMSQIIFGKNPVIEAFSAGQNLEKVYILATLRGETEIKIRNLCKENNVPLAKVPEIKLNELCRNKAHQGIAALISPVTYVAFETLIEETMATGGFFVVLDQVTDVRNIGAIARSAYYFGASGLVLAGNYSGQINEDTVKTSAGAILKLKLCRVGSLLSAVSDMQNRGIWVTAADAKGNKDVKNATFTGPTAILMGSEDKGLHYKVLEIADETVRVPGTGTFDSLNVSVAAGIMMYEYISREK
jgi:23S rRNA (guanosine2251-2'-O)-methyltransferase